MKKTIILGLSAVGFLFIMNSCFKSSNCQCTTTYKETGEVSVSNESVTSVTGGKKQRESFCASNEYSDATTKVECELTK